MKKLIISLAAILALSSCGIYSKYKPVTEIPDGLYGHGGTDTPGLTSADPEIQRSDTAANFGNLSWREVFTDPYLRVLIDSALVRNTDLRTAHLRVKEAEATLLSARLSYLPAFHFLRKVRQVALMAEKLLRPIHCPSVPVGRSISLAD